MDRCRDMSICLFVYSMLCWPVLLFFCVLCCVLYVLLCCVVHLLSWFGLLWCVLDVSWFLVVVVMVVVVVVAVVYRLCLSSVLHYLSIWWFMCWGWTFNNNTQRNKQTIAMVLSEYFDIFFKLTDLIFHFFHAFIFTFTSLYFLSFQIYIQHAASFLTTIFLSLSLYINHCLLLIVVVVCLID